MAQPDSPPPVQAALQPIAPGPLVRLEQDALRIDVAPQAGGRIARLVHAGVDWLVPHGGDHVGSIAWGCFPMLPWAGRVRHGRFGFRGQACQLPVNLGMHAIHGLGFAAPWRVTGNTDNRLELGLRLPRNEVWPFGGHARQSFEIGPQGVHLGLSLTAEDRAMPATLGWHPWFVKPERLNFQPQSYYPRDAEGIARLPTMPPPPGPWDDCFVNASPVGLQLGGQHLQLSSSSHHWVVYDQPEWATCIEPQSGPPDAFNLGLSSVIEPGETLSAWFRLEWLQL